MPTVTWEVGTLTVGRNLLRDISGVWQYRMCVPKWWTALKVSCNGPCFLVSMPCTILSLRLGVRLWPTEYGKGNEMSRPWLCYITLGGWLVVNSCSPTGFIEAGKHCLILLLKLLWTYFLCRLFSFLPPCKQFIIQNEFFIHYSVIPSAKLFLSLLPCISFY